MPLQQSLDALARANETRFARVEVKRKLHDGEMLIGDALEEPCCQSARVWTLICAHYGVGDAKATKLLARLHIGPGRRVRDLTDRQRQLVVAAVPKLGLRRAA